jgi:glycosyltransferase XagB
MILQEKNSGTSQDVPHSARAVFPPEIAFLIRHGVSEATLEAIASMPPPIDHSSPGYDEIAIRNGFVTEDCYYRALAAEKQLPFVTELGDLELSVKSQCLRSLLVMANKKGMRAVAAPTRRRLSYIVNCNSEKLSGLVITTPTRLKAEVRRLLRPRTIITAAHSVTLSHPGQSASEGLADWHIGVLLIVTPFLSFSLTMDALSTAATVGMVLLPFFILSILLRLAASTQLRSPHIQPIPLLYQALPTYTVIVPLFRETRIVKQLVASLSALDYPKAALDIKIVVEESDPDTLAKLNESDLPPYFDVIIAPRGLPQTKPRALNIALQEAIGEYVTIFDAEDIPSSGQLRLAASLFSILPADVGSLQAELRIDNGADSLAARLLALEYAGLFTVINPGLTKLGSPFLLGGTSNHFRTDVLRDIGGWDAWNLTEDADIGCRLLAHGYKVMTMGATTCEEAPISWDAWTRQRIRWMKGFLQTAVTLSRNPSQMISTMGGRAFATLITLSFGTVISALFFPVALIAVPIVAWHHSADFYELSLFSVLMGFASAFYLFGFASMIIPSWIGASRADLIKWRLWSLLMPFYAVAISFAAWISLFELARRPFYWNKTEHGLSKSRLKAEA